MRDRSRPVLVLLVVTVALLAALPAAAQSSACVHLQVGAGYAAWMRVVSGNYASEWSDSFPIGQTRCQSLSAIGNGQPFTVQVSAVLGSSKVPCQPSNLTRDSGYAGSVTFLASGTTLNVKCQMPSISNAATLDNATAATDEGKKAAENVKKNKPKAPKG